MKACPVCEKPFICLDNEGKRVYLGKYLKVDNGLMVFVCPSCFFAINGELSSYYVNEQVDGIIRRMGVEK